MIFFKANKSIINPTKMVMMRFDLSRVAKLLTIIAQRVKLKIIWPITEM